ncbi:cell division protein FtsQ/DivIB [Arcanobacterium phocae]|uniref:cell division protein FtsQ/DivIB n=1 Tax=Arcanobacterium phocae TaxID=131112 RepID=UPI0012F90352|nr:cell division protein FtsQ/DivIB [Arcanobacterium phocae]
MANSKIEQSQGGVAPINEMRDFAQDVVPTALVDTEVYIDDADSIESIMVVHQNKNESVKPAVQPVELSERLQERRAERRRIRLKQFGYVLGAVSGLLFLLWIIFFSPLFAYEYHAGDIRGLADNSIVDKNKLADVLKSHNGEHVLLFDDEELQADVKNTIAEVDRISSVYRFPNGLAFDVVAHVPVACVVDGEDCQGIAQDGTKLTVPSDQLASLPKIKGFPEDVDRKDAMTALMSVLDALPDDFRATISQLSIDQHQMVQLTLTDGRTVAWGKSEENDRKAKILASLLSLEAKFIDISAPNAPVTSN